MKLMKFQAAWCAPCRALSATMAQMDIEHEIIEVDIDKNIEAVSNFNIRGVPTLIIFDDEGVEKKRHTGGLTKEQLIKFLA